MTITVQFANGTGYARAAGASTGTITSTARTPADQARANNCFHLGHIARAGSVTRTRDAGATLPQIVDLSMLHGGA